MAIVIKKNRFKKNPEKAEKLLKEGKIAIYPTETCYGVGCIISSKKAVEKIYKLKKRPRHSPLLIVAADIEMMKEYAVLGEKGERIVKGFMPGPLTLVIKKTERVPEWFKGERIGIRIPSNKIARTLCTLAREPIVSTSANLSGEKPIYEIEKIKRLFEKKVDLIIDAGNLEQNKPSTVFDLGREKILRKGPISREKIEKTVKELN